MKIARPVDMVRFGNHMYSDKPPVLAALASPIYGVLVMLGVRFTGSEGQFVLDNLAITWLVVGTCSALTLVWLRQILQAVPIPPLGADLLTLAFGFGSQLLTYAVTFNNHSVAAALIAGAMAKALLERPGSRAWRDRFAVGLLAGFAAVIDLPAGCLMLAGLGLLLAVRSRMIPLAFLAGSSGPLLFHAWLQSQVTGTPLPVEMYPGAFDYPGSFWLTPDGTFHEYGPRICFGLELLLGPPGWLTLTPVLGFGLAGLGDGPGPSRRPAPADGGRGRRLAAGPGRLLYVPRPADRLRRPVVRDPDISWRSRRPATSSRWWRWVGSGGGRRPRCS